MNYTNYETWQENKLIPSLPPNSVVVVDSVQVDPAPTSASTKSELQITAQDWTSYCEHVVRQEEEY
jgi:hypothetical protein